MAGLPVISTPKGIRPSKNSKRRATVLVLVHLLIAAHITHWLVTGSTVTPVEPSEAMALPRDGVLNAGLIFFSITILLTAVFGRFFCGWACHLVALQDLCRWLLMKIGIRPQPLRSRLLRLVPFVAFLYMFLWPAVYRLWADEPITKIHLELTTEHFWATFPGWIIGTLTFLICGFVIVYLLGAKGFCTYACPYGAIFGVVDRLAPLRIRVTDACQGCAHCTATCSSNVRVHEEVRQYGMVVDDGCMKCLDCVSVCPNDALYYGAGPRRPQPLTARPRTDSPGSTPSWGEEIVLALGFVLAFFTFRGLYGLVPFLMALGLSAVLAYLSLIGFRLLRLPNVALRRWVLKRQGRLRPAGGLYLSLAAIVIVLWAHSAWIRYHQFRGESLYAQSSALRLEALELTAEPPTIPSTALDRARHGIRHLETVDRWGLTTTVGNAGRLAWFYFVSGAPAQLDSAARTAIARGEYEAFMHHLLGMQALWSGEPDSAVQSFDLGIAASRDPTQFLVNRGLVLAATGRMAEAETSFDRALEHRRDSPEILYNSGLAKALQGNSEAAIQRFEEAVAVDPEHLEARENLAGLLASLGRYDEAAAHYRAALDRAPGDPETHLLLARVLTELGDFESALDQVERSLSLEPGRQEAIILRASLESRIAER